MDLHAWLMKSSCALQDTQSSSEFWLSSCLASSSCRERAIARHGSKARHRSGHSLRSCRSHDVDRYQKLSPRQGCRGSSETPTGICYLLILLYPSINFVDPAFYDRRFRAKTWLLSATECHKTGLSQLQKVKLLSPRTPKNRQISTRFEQQESFQLQNVRRVHRQCQ